MQQEIRVGVFQRHSNVLDDGERVSSSKVPDLGAQEQNSDFLAVIQVPAADRVAHWLKRSLRWAVCWSRGRGGKPTLRTFGREGSVAGSILLKEVRPRGTRLVLSAVKL